VRKRKRAGDPNPIDRLETLTNAEPRRKPQNGLARRSGIGMIEPADLKALNATRAGVGS